MALLTTFSLFVMLAIATCCPYEFTWKGDKKIKWQETHTMMFCDRGEGKSGKWYVTKGKNCEYATYEGCTKKKLSGKRDGGPSDDEYANLFPMGGEDIKGMQHMEQFIYKCDSGSGYGKVKVGGKECKTKAYALVVHIGFGLPY